MKCILTRVAVFVVGVAAAGTALAQNNPSLGDTLSFIRDTIGRSAASYNVQTTDSATNQTWTHQALVRSSDAAADPAACTIKFRWHTQIGDKSTDADQQFSLTSAKGVRVISMEDDLARLNADAGHPTWTTKVAPEVWVVLVQNSNGDFNTIDSLSRATADRLATSLLHAAQLCRGGE